MNDNYGWDFNPDDRMIIDIKRDGKKIMGISVHEIIESTSRRKVLEHVRECDRSPWLHNWHKERMEDTVSVLRGVPI